MPWNKPLAYEVHLRDGRVLRTLHDLRDVFASDRFASITHWSALEYALYLLLRAADTGFESDIEAATDQACVVFRLQGMMRDVTPRRPRR
jgi:hypothetical protein